MADDNIDDLLKQVEASMNAAKGTSPLPPAERASPSVKDQSQAERRSRASDPVTVGRVVGGLIAGGVAGAAVWLVLTLTSALIIPAVLVAFVATTIAWVVRR